MSSYIEMKKNPKTGLPTKCLCIDDYYGSHIYGYGFRKDGKNADWETKFEDCDFYKQEELIK